MNEIFKLIGVVIKNSQVIEYNMALAMGLHRVTSEFDERKKIPLTEYRQIEKDAVKLRESMSQKTLGQVIEEISDTNCLKPKQLNKLKTVLEDRNYIVHQIFKDEFEPDPEEKEKIKTYLIEVINNMSRANQSLSSTIESLKEKYDSIK